MERFLVEHLEVSQSNVVQRISTHFVSGSTTTGRFRLNLMNDQRERALGPTVQLPSVCPSVQRREVIPTPCRTHRGGPSVRPCRWVCGVTTQPPRGGSERGRALAPAWSAQRPLSAKPICRLSDRERPGAFGWYHRLTSYSRNLTDQQRGRTVRDDTQTPYHTIMSLAITMRTIIA